MGNLILNFHPLPMNFCSDQESMELLFQVQKLDPVPMMEMMMD